MVYDSIRGDLVMANRDGVVVVPREFEADVIGQAWTKVQGETRMREEIRQGMKASEAWERFGIL